MQNRLPLFISDNLNTKTDTISLHLLKLFISTLLLSSATLLFSSCRGSDEPGSSKKNGRSYLKCADIYPSLDNRTIQLGPLILTQKKRELKITGIPSSIIRIGLLAGIYDGSPETDKNINYFLDRFKAAKVQAIAVAGGVGTTKEQIIHTLVTLSKAPVPLLLTPGANESFPEFEKALQKVTPDYPQFIDMTRIRKVFMKQVVIISLPGYTNTYYLKAKEQGCSFDQDDISNIEDFTDNKHVAVLLSPTPPLGKGSAASDIGRLSINVGDADILKVMKDADIRFALSGIIYEAGGNAASIKDNAPVPKNIWSTSFLLQAGSAAATPVVKADKGRLSGMASIVEFSGNKGRYKIIYPK